MMDFVLVSFAGEEDRIANETGLDFKIENVASSLELKLEIARAGNKPDTEALQKQIRQRLSEAIICSELKERHEELKTEISEMVQCSAGMDGNLQKETKHEEPRVEVHWGANSSFAQCMYLLALYIIWISFCRNVTEVNGIERDGV
ncbi:hypothetical protein V6N11_064698 [Hibiscus sabdariffa]|uniref:Uncharacterized protein n=1 Tax=Hibiscus sabdariffa TaxID=183260 RepID=A0ABR2NBP9_9ROSI